MPTDDNDQERDNARRKEMSAEQRLDLVERDLRSHSRSLTVITKAVNGMGDSFSEKQVEQLKRALADALGDVGLRIDGQDHVDAAREDLRFLRRFRLTWDSAAKKVGTTVLIAIVGVAMTIIGAGFWAWLRGGLK